MALASMVVNLNVNPLVSILIPAYYAEEFIAETIESALAQTWPNREILVLDDGSADRTLKIAKEFQGRGVVVHSQSNQGAAATRNNLFAASRGDFIQWLDADDLLSPRKISDQMEALRDFTERQVLLSSAWGYFHYRPQKTRFLRSSLWEDLSPLEWLTRKMEGNLHMQTATWLVSRELTEAAGPWNTRLLGDDDGEYFTRVIMASKGTKFVHTGKVLYRRSGYGRLSYIGLSDKKLEAQAASMRMNVDYIRSIADTDRVRKACVTYLQNWSGNFYPGRLDLFSQVQAMASELGGEVRVPSLSWKYAWIQKLFGWTPAKRAQVWFPRVKGSFIRRWDKFLHQISPRNAAASE